MKHASYTTTKGLVSLPYPLPRLFSEFPTEETLEDGQLTNHYCISEIRYQELDSLSGLARPYREVYWHALCGTLTRMPELMAKSIQVFPDFYRRLFCCHCKSYVKTGEKGELVWANEISPGEFTITNPHKYVGT